MYNIIKGSNDLSTKLMFTLDQESSNRINSYITITRNTNTFLVDIYIIYIIYIRNMYVISNRINFIFRQYAIICRHSCVGSSWFPIYIYILLTAGI